MYKMEQTQENLAKFISFNVEPVIECVIQLQNAEDDLDILREYLECSKPMSEETRMNYKVLSKKIKQIQESVKQTEANLVDITHNSLHYMMPNDLESQFTSITYGVEI